MDGSAYGEARDAVLTVPFHPTWLNEVSAQLGNHSFRQNPRFGKEREWAGAVPFGC